MITRIAALAALLGICLGFVSGFVENRLGSASIPENRYYGFPLVWRLSNLNAGETYYYFELFIDCLFWILIVSIIAFGAAAMMKLMSRKSARFAGRTESKTQSFLFLILHSLDVHLQIVSSVWKAPFIILRAWKLFTVPHAEGNSPLHCPVQHWAQNTFAAPSSVHFFPSDLFKS